MMKPFCNYLQQSLSSIIRSDLMLIKPVGSQAPLLLEVTRTILAHAESIDLVRQFEDWPGGANIVSRHEPRSCIRVPAWFNFQRRSGLPLMHVCWLAAVHLHATHPGHGSLAGIRKMMTVLQSLHEAYMTAKRKGRLDENHTAMAQESHAILNSPGSAQAPVLQAAVSTLIDPLVDLPAVISTYPQSETPSDKVRNRCESVNLKKLQRFLSDEVKAVAAMSQDQRVRWSKRFYEIALQFADGQAIETNSDGMPTLFWPRDTSSHHIFCLAARCSNRAFLSCDGPRADVWSAVDTWKDGWTNVIVMWISYSIKNGNRDEFSGVEFDWSGSRHCPNRPTLVAHATHGKPFFSAQILGTDFLTDFDMDAWAAGCNATVQSAMTNFGLRKFRISVIASLIWSSRTAVGQWLHSFKRLGLVDLSEADIQAIIERIDPLQLTTVEAFRNNSVESYELL